MKHVLLVAVVVAFVAAADCAVYYFSLCFYRHVMAIYYKILHKNKNKKKLKAKSYLDCFLLFFRKYVITFFGLNYVTKMV